LLFNLETTLPKDLLEKQLIAQEITGYIYIENDKIYYRIHENGLTQTITKRVLDQCLQTSDLILSVITTDPGKLPVVLESLNSSTTYFEDSYSNINSSANRLVIYFFALLAIQAMYGSIWGIGIVNDLQANMSARAMRV